MGFSKRLCAARKYKNWSQSDLARECGLTRAAICKWEKPGARYPSAAALHKAAKALDVSAEQLLTGKTTGYVRDTRYKHKSADLALPMFKSTARSLLDQWSKLPMKDRKAALKELEKFKDLKITKPKKKSR